MWVCCGLWQLGDVAGSMGLDGGCGFLVVAEESLQFEEWGFVEVEAEEGDGQGDCHDCGCSAEHGEGFGVEVIVHVEADVRDEHSVE